MTQEHQKQLSEVLGSQRRVYDADLARMLGSIYASIFLCQLLYWWGRSNNPEWIVKTVAEFEEETALTESNQQTCIAKLTDLGILEYKLAGVPPKRNFHINLEKLWEVASEWTEKQGLSANSI